jgi:cytochrome c2
VRYVDLLSLPQQTAVVPIGDGIREPATVTGVPLASLAKALTTHKSLLIVAICSDGYRAHYPSSYVMAHSPLLVLKINGHTPDTWNTVAGGDTLGPYLIVNPQFTPSFQVLSHKDEAQDPYGVVRIEIHDEQSMLTRLRPVLRYTRDSPEFMGYQIAIQNCLRCHNRGSDGGDKAKRSWYQLSAWAYSNPESFKQYIHAPMQVMPCSRMLAQPSYDSQTLEALTVYFRSFLTTQPLSSRRAR